MYDLIYPSIGPLVKSSKACDHFVPLDDAVLFGDTPTATTAGNSVGTDRRVATGMVAGGWTVGKPPVITPVITGGACRRKAVGEINHQKKPPFFFRTAGKTSYDRCLTDLSWPFVVVLGLHRHYWPPPTFLTFAAIKHKDKIRKNFVKRRSTHMRDMFTDIRKSGERPDWIAEKVWAELNAAWDSLEYTRRREKNRQNRASDVGGIDSSLHTEEYIQLRESQPAAVEGSSTGSAKYSEYHIWSVRPGDDQTTCSPSDVLLPYLLGSSPKLYPFHRNELPKAARTYPGYLRSCPSLAHACPRLPALLRRTPVPLCCCSHLWMLARAHAARLLTSVRAPASVRLPERSRSSAGMRFHARELESLHPACMLASCLRSRALSGQPDNPTSLVRVDPIESESVLDSTRP
ncbi:hypothetical protein MA16_Dca011141 [Dendrobium catenatum]|uniref:Uncharacterized protein n=1 Tax=Dendrobium catenatum TaxID=906689 RepID=A0A2I0WSF4_9ASPA|nr:hypothetical protein MA16_Dca011141 [Dendrobium catenatum]